MKEKHLYSKPLVAGTPIGEHLGKRVELGEADVKENTEHGCWALNPIHGNKIRGRRMRQFIAEEGITRFLNGDIINQLHIIKYIIH